ncbi:unnamed protein product [Caenorhabditis auriculariae]|uniref:Uncharacterized protein n=1 Tax=Caenorhabditis auriculariae TaxID=2777116 RepID=A0A8S1GY10_9PELO|nr:unnamed protein product [Caenorhabditis auriculariae]
MFPRIPTSYEMEEDYDDVESSSQEETVEDEEMAQANAEADQRQADHQKRMDLLNELKNIMAKAREFTTGMNLALSGGQETAPYTLNNIDAQLLPLMEKVKNNLKELRSMQ